MAIGHEDDAFAMFDALLDAAEADALAAAASGAFLPAAGLAYVRHGVLDPGDVEDRRGHPSPSSGTSTRGQFVSPKSDSMKVVSAPP